MSSGSSGDPSITHEEIKHLEFIQAIVARLGNGSFLIKGWTMTVAGAFFGVSATSPSWKIAAAGMIPIVGFWLLDSYFLRQERLFRKLYDDVRRPTVAVELFSMNVQPYHAAVPWGRVISSHTMVNFYGAIALVDIAFIVGGIVRSASG
ncbi:hypothetical protein ND808_21000 [Streptomyces sp. DR7-3]|uniref:hypothetical protein n=1 Tax=Streptomyces malaysiensis TaxID=92644 RepID=UPI002044B2E4|nr:hypothetical protein [Streptomyces sp. DR7-3]MCM3808321.1 hypothetical protein [Streptomyces sp. DR7-3]